jgi:AraC-like DNA-binding protein/ligand-binding sensor protein
MNNLNMTAAILTERKNVAKGESAMTQPSAARSSDQEVMLHLSRSQVFKDYERAFSEATGLPLNIRRHDSWSPAHHGKTDHDSFAAILAHFNKARAACLTAQTDASQEPFLTTRTVTWFAGLSESAVPVYVGDHILGFLETGEVMLKNPTRKHFASVTRQLRAWGYKTDWKQLERAYFRSCVLRPDRYHAMLGLLKFFAQQLSALINQMMLEKNNGEPPLVQRARKFINEHKTEMFSLSSVAQASGASVFHFCKVFKKSTGLTFTDYVAHARLEDAKTELLKPNRRISEVAYDVGFQSLTQFNRAFKRIIGCSPTQFRESLPKRRLV